MHYARLSHSGGRFAIEAATRRVLIGTSGWHRFYHLRFYAEHFPATELNGVFYRTPSLAAVRARREQTPDDFVFAWRASKFITHWKRLSDKSRNSIALMEGRLKRLGPKAGPVLFQLPPAMRANHERLVSFLRLLPKKRSYAFEFRHPSWYDDDILDVLRDHGIALCLSDHHDAPSPWLATADHVYVRGHGPGGRYRGHYPDKDIARLGEPIRQVAAPGRTIHATSTTTRRAPRRRMRNG